MTMREFFGFMFASAIIAALWKVVVSRPWLLVLILGGLIIFVIRKVFSNKEK